MGSKKQIEKLRDNAELAQAAYGYFDCVGNKFDIKNEDKFAALENILDITYKDSKIIDEWGFRVGTLNGDFAPLQAKRFFERYELIHHIPNTTISGFSATLFYDDCAKNYTLAFRGARAAVFIRGGGVFEWRANGAPRPHRPSEPLLPFQSRLSACLHG